MEGWKEGVVLESRMGGGCYIILSFSLSCTIERTLRFANDEESERKEVWCSDNDKSLNIYI